MKSWLAKGRHASTDFGKSRTQQSSMVSEGCNLQGIIIYGNAFNDFNLLEFSLNCCNC